MTGNPPPPAAAGIAISPDLLAVLKPGKKLRHTFGRLTANPRREVWHIRAIVDEDQVVYRRWSPSRGWVYEINGVIYFQLLWQSGALTA